MIQFLIFSTISLLKYNCILTLFIPVNVIPLVTSTVDQDTNPESIQTPAPQGHSIFIIESELRLFIKLKTVYVINLIRLVIPS